MVEIARTNGPDPIYRRKITPGVITGCIRSISATATVSCDLSVNIVDFGVILN